MNAYLYHARARTRAKQAIAAAAQDERGTNRRRRSLHEKCGGEIIHFLGSDLC